jgi:hypothetical protein
MRRVSRAAIVVLVVILAVTVGSTLALDCHGRLVVIGASPWEVKERCGEPAHVEDVITYLPQSFECDQNLWDAVGVRTGHM